MCAHSPVEEGQVGCHPAPETSWRGLRRWRSALAGASFLLAVAAAAWTLMETRAAGEFGPLIAVGGAAAFVGPPLVLGLLSLEILRRLGPAPASALKLALAQDAVVLAIAGAGAVADSRGLLKSGGSLGLLWFWVGVALVFGAEAAYLLRVRWRWRPAWRAFAGLAVAVGAAGLLVSTTAIVRPRPDLQPLVTHIAAHWVRVPPDAAGSTLPCSASSGKHSHYVVLQTEPSTLEISVGHDRGGHWYFSQGETYHPTFFLSSDSARDVHSPAEAREYLGELGVVDSGLSLAGTTRRHSSSVYEFPSPLGEGRYFVHDTGLVEFWLDHPLEIP